MLRMIAEDCNDMGIQMNYAYASMLTGVDLDNELRANAKKYRLGFTYETKTTARPDCTHPRRSRR